VGTLRVFAAASLADVAEQLGRAYERSGGTRLDLNLASSSLLARQIEAGAGAALYLAASREWGERVAASHGNRAAPLFVYATNRLVVVAPADSSLAFSTLADAPAGSGVRWVLADPEHVPAGIYAREALQSEGIYERVSERMVAAGDARLALAYVARGEVDLGLVYATDAAGEPRVRSVLEIPATAHTPIEYPVVVLQGARPGAAAFAAFLRSATARRVLEAHGFSVP